MQDSTFYLSFALVYAGLVLYTITRLASLPVKMRSFRRLPGWKSPTNEK